VQYWQIHLFSTAKLITTKSMKTKD
jgi:hypothetical protein